MRPEVARAPRLAAREQAALSEVGVETIRRAAKVHPICDLQIEYSLVSRGPEEKIFPALAEMGIGATVYGTAMLATVPELVAAQIRATRPHLKTKALPFALKASYAELLWPVATDDDAPCRFARAKVAEIARTLERGNDRRAHLGT